MTLLDLMMFELVDCTRCGRPRVAHWSAGKTFCNGHGSDQFQPDPEQESRVKRVAKMAQQKGLR